LIIKYKALIIKTLFWFCPKLQDWNLEFWFCYLEVDLRQA